MRMALVNTVTGLIENVVEVVDGDGSVAPENCIFIPSDIADVSDTWDGAQIVPAPKPVEEVNLEVSLPAEVVEVGPTLSAFDLLSARVAVLEKKLGL